MSLPDLQEPLALLEEKKYDAAVEVLKHKVTALPAHLGAHVLLAYAHEGRKQWTEALEAWEEVHFLLPNSPIAAAGKQRVLRRMDGLEVDAAAPRPTAAPRPSTAASASSPQTDEEEDADQHASPEPDLGAETAREDDAEPTAEQSEAAATADDDAPEETDSEAKDLDDEADQSTDERSATGEEDDGLAQLRRQAEREARQGGARPGLADGPSAGDLSPPPDDPSSTPEEQVEQFEEEESSDDLDRLIDKLQSARIDPDPDAEAEAPPEDPTPEEDTEEVVSETLARIHEGQDDYEKAAHIYAQLADQEPQRADEFRRKARDMRRKADAENGSAA